jgi:hypothetical protein
MNKIRLIAILTTLFVASNALAVGNNRHYINPMSGVCNIDRMPLYHDPNFGFLVWGGIKSSGNKTSYTIARRGAVIKARCLMKDHGLEIPKAVPFGPDPVNVPGRVCRIALDGVDYDTFDWKGTITPSGVARLHCTCELGNGCEITPPQTPP